MTRKLNDIDRKIGANMRAIRCTRGLSQTEVGRALGVTFQQIQKYESGDNAVATTRIPALCRALHCTPADLFEGAMSGVKPKPVRGLSSDAVRMALDIAALSPASRGAIARFITTFRELDAGAQT